MSDLSTQLPDRLNRPEETGLDPGLLVPLLRLLVDGDPVNAIDAQGTIAPVVIPIVLAIGGGAGQFRALQIDVPYRLGV